MNNTTTIVSIQNEKNKQKQYRFKKININKMVNIHRDINDFYSQLDLQESQGVITQSKQQIFNNIDGISIVLYDIRVIEPSSDPNSISYVYILYYVYDINNNRIPNPIASNPNSPFGMDYITVKNNTYINTKTVFIDIHRIRYISTNAMYVEPIILVNPSLKDMQIQLKQKLSLVLDRTTINV